MRPTPQLSVKTWGQSGGGLAEGWMGGVGGTVGGGGGGVGGTVGGGGGWRYGGLTVKCCHGVSLGCTKGAEQGPEA